MGPPARSPKKPWIAGIHAYVPGKAAGADGRELVKLRPTRTRSAPAERALAARRRGFGSCRAIPIPTTELRAAIGALHGIDPVRIVCGTGSDELLNLAAQAFAGPATR